MATVTADSKTIIENLAKRGNRHAIWALAEIARLTAELAARTDERDHYAAACSRIDQALAEAREWHDMVEDRPNHNQKVLFWWGKEVMLGVYSEQAMKFYTSGTQMLQARYWKELPNYPKFGNAVAWDSNI